MKNLLLIDPSPNAFMLVVTLAIGYNAIHADTAYAADYMMMTGWADVTIVDPLVAPMDVAASLVHDVAASGRPAVVWTAIQPAALPNCPLRIIAKDDTSALAAWLEKHR